ILYCHLYYMQFFVLHTVYSIEMAVLGLQRKDSPKASSQCNNKEKIEQTAVCKNIKRKRNKNKNKNKLGVVCMCGMEVIVMIYGSVTTDKLNTWLNRRAERMDNERLKRNGRSAKVRLWNSNWFAPNGSYFYIRQVFELIRNCRELRKRVKRPVLRHRGQQYQLFHPRCAVAHSTPFDAFWSSHKAKLKQQLASILGCYVLDKSEDHMAMLLDQHCCRNRSYVDMITNYLKRLEQKHNNNNNNKNRNNNIKKTNEDTAKHKTHVPKISICHYSLFFIPKQITTITRLQMWSHKENIRKNVNSPFCLLSYVKYVHFDINSSLSKKIMTKNDNVLDSSDLIEQMVNRSH
ncbi:hypothetical protein RFI_38245, partial [Reticulomyxa filosa]